MNLRVDRMTLDLAMPEDAARELAMLVAERLAAVSLTGRPLRVETLRLEVPADGSNRAELADRIAAHIVRELARATAR